MMNELDDFKNTWKTISETEFRKDYSVDDLKKLVKRRSNGELANIRRKFMIELGITLALSVVIVLFVQFIKPSDTKYAFMFIGVILVIGFIPYVNVLRLNFSNHPDLKRFLIDFLSRFNTLVKQNIRNSVILMPIACLGGLLLGSHSALTQGEWTEFLTKSTILLIAFFVLLISLVGYWVQTRYFNWIYGNNIQRLRDCLTDLEEVEENE